MDEATESDCYYIVKFFESKGDETLTFNDFLQIIMPCDDQHLRAEIAQRPNFVVDKAELLNSSVEEALSTLLEKEIAMGRVLEELKQTIECSKQFDYVKAF